MRGNNPPAIREADPGLHLATDLARCRRALEQGRGKEAIAGAEKALFLAIEGATGLKGRGLLRQELEQKLKESALAPATATELTELLQSCETARFTGEAESGAATEIVASTRTHLDWRGLLPSNAFDDSLTKTPA